MTEPVANLDPGDLQLVAPVVACRYPAAATLNPALSAAFAALGPDDFDRRSHFIGGRFENLYVDRARLPGVVELLGFAEAIARRLLADPAVGPRFAPATGDADDPADPHRAAVGPDTPLRCGFWLNAMGPGQATSRHTHEEADERVSGVYYISVPPDSGDLLCHDGPFEVRIRPTAGLLLVFPPHLLHSVTSNESDRQRLSLAFNIGVDAGRDRRGLHPQLRGREKTSDLLRTPPDAPGGVAESRKPGHVDLLRSPIFGFPRLAGHARGTPS